MLADWYSEHGQEDRGEFIRVQVRKTGDNQRIAGLMRWHRKDWCHPLSPQPPAAPLGNGAPQSCPVQWPVFKGSGQYAVHGTFPESKSTDKSGVVIFHRGFVAGVARVTWVTALGGVEDWLRRWPLRSIRFHNPVGERIEIKGWTASHVVDWPRGQRGYHGLVCGSRSELVAAINPWLQDVYHRLYAGVPA